MIAVEVIRSLSARSVERRQLELPEGATVAQALSTCGWLPDSTKHDAASTLAAPQMKPGGEAPPARLGIWGRRCGLHQRLRDGDRLEIYRPLQLDPKEARRCRARAGKARAPSGTG